MVDPRTMSTNLNGLNENVSPETLHTSKDILNESSDVRVAVQDVIEENTTEKRVAKLLESVEGAIEQTSEGLFVFPDKMTDSQMMYRFLIQIFQYDAMSNNRGIFFVLQDLDYEALQSILYSNVKNLQKKIRIAKGIRLFPENRLAIYRKVSSFKDRNGVMMEAKYYFEKLYIKEMVPTMIPGFDTPQMMEHERETTLDIDEFIVHLWRS